MKPAKKPGEKKRKGGEKPVPVKKKLPEEPVHLPHPPPRTCQKLVIKDGVEQLCGKGAQGKKDGILLCAEHDRQRILRRKSEDYQNSLLSRK